MFRFGSKRVLQPKLIRHHHRPYRAHHHRRGISTTGYNTSNGAHHDTNPESGSADTASTRTSESPLDSAPHIAGNKFDQLDKDISIINVGMENLEACQNRMSTEMSDIREMLDTSLKDLCSKMDKDIPAIDVMASAPADKVQADPNYSNGERIEQELDRTIDVLMTTLASCNRNLEGLEWLGAGPGSIPAFLYFFYGNLVWIMHFRILCFDMTL
ncbi:unnamed protein product [Tuber melanosporum]|uniref:(Perigord truffle) hypothetical protein n=1 Tax=Tuber melanosporum (strain Mel28) TaxID=656061 RepID=D5G576_TUBMM|nr:uncharacterized protein GSTUM_00000343001 [Tuber melanosporum]CAZ79669.1 unnamed protein product [Tuber melanosporum]